MSGVLDQAIRAVVDILVEALRAEVEAALARIVDLEAGATAEIARCRLLSKKQVREVLNCSLRQLDRWIADGVLPIVWLDRRPRFDPRDIEALAQKRKLRESPGPAARMRRAA
jgi:hypothetical protein